MNHFPKTLTDELFSIGGHAERSSRISTSPDKATPKRTAGAMGFRYKKYLAALGVIGFFALGSSPASARPISEWQAGCRQAGGNWSSWNSIYMCTFYMQWADVQYYSKTPLDRYGREVGFCEGGYEGGRYWSTC